METTIDTQYRFPMRAIQSSGKWWWIALDDDCFSPHQLDENPTRLVNEWFTDQEAASVEGMTLFDEQGPHNKAVYKRFMNLRSFTRLKFLSIPLDAIEYIDIESVAPRLEHLHITSPRAEKYFEFYKKGHHPVIFEADLPNLKTLQLLASPILFRNFDAARYPSLEWLDCQLEFDKSGKFFKYFTSSPSMKGYSLEVVSKKDLLKVVPKTITALRFWSITTRSFDFSLLSEFENLKYLEIAGSFTPIDCSVFSSLPCLTELELGSCKAVANTAALLESKSLKRLKMTMNKQIDLTDSVEEKLKGRLDEFLYW